MKFLVALTMFLTASAFMTGAGASPAITYVGHEKVAVSLETRRDNGPSLFAASDLKIIATRRSVPGEVQVHEKETNVVYVLDGTATIVTGGTVVGGKVVSPGQIQGSSIQGGRVQRLTKGDLLVIPAGTPYWYKEISQPINRLVVKVLKP